MKLLHIAASPRGDASYSRRAAQAFIEAFTEARPGVEVEALDLFEADLPVFAAPAARAKYAVLAGQAPEGAAAAVWQDVIARANQLKQADVIVISSPMWNFSIPYVLKHYIDVICQPGLTFAVSEEGYKGLVLGKKVVLLLARGGDYSAESPGNGYDHQKPYLMTILGLMGMTDVASIELESTMAAQLSGDESDVLGKIEQARQLGALLAMPS